MVTFLIRVYNACRRKVEMAPRVQSRDVTQDGRREGRAARSWPGLRSDDRPDESRLCGLEYVPVGLATPTRCLLRAAFIAKLLLFGDVG